MVSGLAAGTYEERLKELKLDTLEERRHQADMCMVCNILHGRGGLAKETWFKPHTDDRNLRSQADPMDIKRSRGRTEIRNNFFSIRVTEDWNKIPSEMKKI